MTVSMRVMSAGDGYKYLLRTVAAADGNRSLSTPLTRYYASDGTPPGRWLGSGLAAVGAGRISAGDQVSEAQLQLLIGAGRDPVTGAPLGLAYPAYASTSDRIAQRVGGLSPQMSLADRAAAIALIEAEETARRTRRAVAGYDFTFSVPKSASVLWAVADARIQAIIADAHHGAVADMVAFIEREVALTRAGATGGDGAVAQVEVTGLVAAAFDHFDSRAGDPHLHTHLVVSNKVRAVLDDKWRSLDGRPLHAATVALSELHEAVFADYLTRSLGVQWQLRAMGANRNPAWAIAGMPETLVAEFSSRSRHINIRTDQLVDDYIATHGHRPSRKVILRLRAQATLATRPQKQVRSLSELTAAWRNRAENLLGRDATRWAGTAIPRRAPTVRRANEVPEEAIAELGGRVVEAVAEKRSTWRHWNLYAEAARLTMGWRFASTRDREAIVGSIVAAAEHASMRLTAPELAPSPATFQRSDGSSVFRPKHSDVFSSQALLEAEDRLLTLSRDTSAPTIPPSHLHLVSGSGRTLRADQLVALESIASSGRAVDLLVGPAGSGKTTAMAALRRAWEKGHGEGAVVGLAPSAVAAAVLSEELGIPTENTEKWRHDHRGGHTTVAAGQLVILDEASLAGTATLDQIATAVAQNGGKLLLVGDWAQLQSVVAGGVLALLAADRGDAPELVNVERFTNDWEKAASLDLRHGRPQAIDAYQEHGRVVGGDPDEMLTAAYRAWKRDQEAGKASILIADNNDTVAELNRRARADRILADPGDADNEVALHDGTAASVGDLVITRRNDRRLRNGHDWARNGSRWIITAIRSDASITVRRPDSRIGGSLVLPADYVAEHIELGYAVTAYRAQGITTDTGHALIGPTTTRENLYVAMTRGRASNNVYVATERPDEADVGPHPGQNTEATACSVLCGVLQHVGAQPSVHQAIAAEQNAWTSIAQLAAEYDTIAAAAQHDRWSALITASPLGAHRAAAVIGSDAFGPLCSALRRAEAHHHEVDVLVPRLIASRRFEDADDVAAVLHSRLTRAINNSAYRQTTRPPRLIAGLIPAAGGPISEEMRQALRARHDLIERRATALVDAAIVGREPWLAELGAMPRDARTLEAWRGQARVVAAYRDRYAIATQNPLGSEVRTDVQRADATMAAAAMHRARRIASSTGDPFGESGRRRASRSGITL